MSTDLWMIPVYRGRLEDPIEREAVEDERRHEIASRYRDHLCENCGQEFLVWSDAPDGVQIECGCGVVILPAHQ